MRPRAPLCTCGNLCIYLPLFPSFTSARAAIYMRYSLARSVSVARAAWAKPPLQPTSYTCFYILALWNLCFALFFPSLARNSLSSSAPLLWAYIFLLFFHFCALSLSLYLNLTTYSSFCARGHHSLFSCFSTILARRDVYSPRGCACFSSNIDWLSNLSWISFVSLSLLASMNLSFFYFFLQENIFLYTHSRRAALIDYIFIRR